MSPSRNRRLIVLNERSVTFKVKDYRIEGPGRYTTMTLDVGEFIRRFLSHVLPKGIHRIRQKPENDASFQCVKFSFALFP